jgi:hypothetical protein
MTLPGSNRDLEQACLLLQEYSFDLGGYAPQELMNVWQQTLAVDPTWIRTAVLEALYQGRYKAFSVEQILLMWKRRGQPVRHFNHDFERVAFGPLDPHASSTALLAATLSSPPVTSSPPPPLQADEPSPTAPSPESAAAVSPTPVETASSQPEIDAENPSPEVDSRPLPAAIADIAPANLPVTAAPSPDFSSTVLTVINPTAPSEDPFNAPEPIQKFVPLPQPSGFYNRLQAVARHLGP